MVQRSRVGLALLVLASSWSLAYGQALDILSGRSLDGSRLTAAAETTENLVKVQAELRTSDAGQKPVLSITANISPPWYTYSTTQKPTGATPTVITVDPSSDFQLVGPFTPTKKPKVETQFGLTLEKFYPSATWQAEIKVRPGVDVKDLVAKGKVHLAVCSPDGKCLEPKDFVFAAKLSTSSPRATIASEGVQTFNSPSGNLTLRGHLEPATAAPGSTATLVISASMAPEWHLYEFAERDGQSLGYKPTLIAFTDLAGLNAAGVKTDKPPQFKPADVPGTPDQKYFKEQVTFSIPIEIPRDAKPGQHTIEGVIGYQVCNDLQCDPPNGAKFVVTAMVGNPAGAAAAVMAFADAKYADAVQATMQSATNGDPTLQVFDRATSTYSSLGVVILASLLGGVILNFMPCVLPVIGLKILSFAEQAGKHRSHILTLNLWYSLGVLVVFWVLATLATVLNLSWGQQFQSTGFNVAMTAIVFVMALSFLGVWEIPIPGFVGSGKASNMAAREGAAGAFAKGCLTTVLATPCSGPFLGPVFGYTLGQPPAVIYLIFTCIGLGLCAPYLIIGAFPSLIRFLPKPGAWMETFKQLMGFVLLGTIVFLFSFMNRDYLVPTFGMMVGLWAGCWWIGRTPLYESLSHKLWAWGQGAAIAALIGIGAFTYLGPHESIIPWKSFSIAELSRQTEAGNTVMIDFTADWCFNCKLNLFTAIETEDVRQAIESNRVVPLLADFSDTENSPEIKQMLAALQSNSIPVLAIFPANRPNEPIILRDLVTKQRVLDALQQAGPSLEKGKTARNE